MKAFNKLIAVCLLLAGMLLGGASALAADAKNEYVLGPGDVIRITVFQNPDLTLETRVSESGSISYPLIGQVAVGGLPVNEAEKRIAKQLKDGGYVLQPQVNILPVQFRGNQVAVLGQVNRPGRYPLDVFNAKITDLLAQAGGITPTGADTVILVGTRGGKPFRQEIDVAELFLSGRTEKDVAVAGGDSLYVHRAPMFYIYGEVQRPGAYRIEREMTLMQALAQGGGLTLRGTQRGIQVNRRDDKGQVQQLSLDMNAPIKPDDVVFVRESIF